MAFSTQPSRGRQYMQRKRECATRAPTARQTLRIQKHALKRMRTWKQPSGVSVLNKAMESLRTTQQRRHMETAVQVGGWTSVNTTLAYNRIKLHYCERRKFVMHTSEQSQNTSSPSRYPCLRSVSEDASPVIEARENPL